MDKGNCVQNYKPSLPIDYVIPEVWQPPETAHPINRPTAGSRTEEELPRGKHSLQLYSLGTPNGVKVE